MKKSSSVNEFLDEATVSHLAELNKIIQSMNNESINTISKLFSIERDTVTSQRSYIQNFILPKLYITDQSIKNDFLDFIDHLDIIEKQIFPKEMINSQFICSTFYFIQIRNDEPKEIDIYIPTQNQNKIKYIQILPEGLLAIKEFQIRLNGISIKNDQIFFNSYLKFENEKKKHIKLSFLNTPQKFFFIQVLYYKKKTLDDLSHYFRKKLSIPSNISDIKAKLCHDGNDHEFNLNIFINLVQKNNSIICPICKENVDFLYYKTKTDEEILDDILDDNSQKFIEKVCLIKKEHLFFSKYKVPNFLKDGPSYLSLCAFFNSINCFESILDFYLRENNHLGIHQKDQSLRSPIHFASFGGNLTIIKALVDNDEQLDSMDINGLQPVHYAAIAGKLEVIQYLNSIGENMFSIQNDEFKSPLHFACQYGNLEIIKYYIDVIIPSSDVNDFNKFISCYCKEFTPLHLASQYGQIDVIKYFLSNMHLAKMQIEYNFSHTPLILACKNGHLSCAKILIDAFKPTIFHIKKALNLTIIEGHLNIVSYIIKNYSIKISPIMILAAISQNNLSIAIFLIHNNEKLKKEISISLIEQIKNFLKNSSRFELDKENNDHKCILDGNQSEVYYTENKKCDDNESLKNVPKKEFTSKNNKLFIKQHGHQLGSDTSKDDDISNDSDTSYDNDTSNDSDISDDDSLNESSSDENLHDMYFVKNHRI